jgi:hypothetical protein
VAMVVLVTWHFLSCIGEGPLVSSVSEIILAVWIFCTFSRAVWKGVQHIARPLHSTGKRNIDRRWQHPHWSRFRTRDPSVPAVQHRAATVTCSGMHVFLLFISLLKYMKGVWTRCNLWSSHDSFTHLRVFQFKDTSFVSIFPRQCI